MPGVVHGAYLTSLQRSALAIPQSFSSQLLSFLKYFSVSKWWLKITGAELFEIDLVTDDEHSDWHAVVGNSLPKIATHH